MRKKLTLLLAIEAAICLIAAIILSLGGTPEGYSGSPAYLVVSFPFYPIALGLRALSLSGVFGNAVALMLYLLICLSPIAYMFYRNRRDKLTPVDILMPLTSFLLFYSIYIMINPGSSSWAFALGSNGDTAFGSAILGGVIYSVLTGYIVLRALRRFSDSGTKPLLKYLKLLLGALCAVLVLGISFTLPAGLISAFRSHGARDGGALGIYAAMGTNTGLSAVFLVLQSLVATAPGVLEILVLYSAIGLVSALERGAYSEETILAAGEMSKLCRNSVVIIMVSHIAINLLQLLPGAALYSTQFSVSLPLGSIIFVLAAMLLAKYFQRGKELKEDSDMII